VEADLRKLAERSIRRMSDEDALNYIANFQRAWIRSVSLVRRRGSWAAKPSTR